MQFVREENKIVEQQQMKIVNKFRKIKLMNKVLDTLTEHAQWQKTDREKNQYKNQMWSKVNQWLGDITPKSTESTEEKVKQEAVSLFSKDMFDGAFLETEEQMSKFDTLQRDFQTVEFDN